MKTLTDRDHRPPRPGRQDDDGQADRAGPAPGRAASSGRSRRQAPPFVDEHQDDGRGATST